MEELYEKLAQLAHDTVDEEAKDVAEELANISRCLMNLKKEDAYRPETARLYHSMMRSMNHLTGKVV